MVLRLAFTVVCLLFREVGTITYRSGPEWAVRFGNKRREPENPPDFCPDFEIEKYLDRQVRAASQTSNVHVN